MIKLFIIHLIITALWVLMTHDATAFNILVGLVVGYLILTIYSLAFHKRYHARLPMSIWLLFYFHYELFSSSFKVLWDIVSPGYSHTPGFIAMPLAAKTPLEIFFTANMISLTPGTLSIALSDDLETLYIHAMFIDDKEQTIADLKSYESTILKAFR